LENILFLDEHFKEEEILIRNSIQKFVNDKVLPIIGDAFEEGVFPDELTPQLASLGVFGMSLPEKYGGIGASAIAYGLACQELEKGDSAIRSFVSVQSSLCMYPIYSFGSEEQRLRFLPEMAQAKIIGCFGLTEPNSGSDPSSMNTYAKKVDGGWKLNGSKLWITNATTADVAIVWAKTDVGIRGFLVEKEFKGFSSFEIKQKMSLRASVTGGLNFDECFVPDANLLPNSERGLVCALSCLTQARYGIAWGAIGAAEACYESALNYCKERVQFGKPLASKQLVQSSLAGMFKEIIKAKLLNLHIGKLKEENKLNHVMVSLAKQNACLEALNIARSCRNLLGANGISLEYPVIRHMQNLESVFTYEGTDNIHQLIIGRHITGLDAFA